MATLAIPDDRHPTDAQILSATGMAIIPLALRTLAVFALLAAAVAIAASQIPRATIVDPGLTAKRNAMVPALPSAPKVVSLVPKQPSGSDEIPLDSDDDPTQAALTWARRLPDDVLQRDLVMLEGHDQFLKFGPVRVSRRLVETVVGAARKVGVEPTTLMAIADKESSLSPTVGAGTSSAKGLFQFIDKTWLGAVRQFGASHGLAREAAEIQGPDDQPTIAEPRERERVLALRTQPWLAALMAAEMIKHDAGRLADSLGRGLTVGETYLTHFLGPAATGKFLETLQDQPKFSAAELLRKPARANRPIFYGKGNAKSLSVGAVHEKIEEMMDLRADRYATVGRISPDASAYVE